MSQSTLIKNTLLFDGTGEPPRARDLLFRDGIVVEIAHSITASDDYQVIDGGGLWLMPGLVDIHTHLDLELEVNPRLDEVLRHGTTSVVVGNCSLGTAFGAQLKGNESPIIDCFTRVENMPKAVLQKVVDKVDWSSTSEYFSHLEQLPLGPNVAAFLPHSMLRIEVMGTHDSVTREPTDQERIEMNELVEAGLQQGYLGVSTDQIIFHYLSNDPHKEHRIPTQFADDREIKEMLDIVREYDRVWQTTPDSDDMFTTIKRFFYTSATLFKRRLRVSALTCLDLVSSPGIYKLMLRLSALLNSPILRGKFHFQALATTFRIWGNGVIAPVFEELESTRQLIALEADDVEGRKRLMDSPEWQQLFRRDWAAASSRGTGNFLLKKKQAAFSLDPEKMIFDDCVIKAWNGYSVQSIYRRLERFQRGEDVGFDDQDREALSSFKAPIGDVMEFFLEGLRHFDQGFRWWLDIANVNPETTEQILFSNYTLPGFNDSGAHIKNLAFYDGNLCALQIAQKRGLGAVAKMIKKLTIDPCEFFNLPRRGLRVGEVADMVLIDPKVLRDYNTHQGRTWVSHEQFETEVMVNRSCGVVNKTFVAGELVFDASQGVTPEKRLSRFGSLLRAVSR